MDSVPLESSADLPIILAIIGLVVLVAVVVAIALTVRNSRKR